MRVTGPGEPAHLLLDIADLLLEFGISYAVVGAFAVSYHGVPRYTDDADAALWLKGTGKSEKDVAARLVAAGYRAELKRGDIDDPILGSILVKDQYENRVDLLLGIRGMDPEASSRCVSAKLLDSSVRIMGAEDLIAMKVSAGGLQDLEDVRGILQVSGNLLNLELLRNLTSRYGPDAARTLDDLWRESRSEEKNG